MIQKRTFLAGMDSDTASELLPEGVDRYRLNVRVLSSENSTVGAIETVLGNTLVPFTLPSGINKTIGAFEDIKRGYVYYFVWNDSNTHIILEYNITANTIAEVLRDTGVAVTVFLNFQPTKLITGVNLVELDDDKHLLYWTDDYNEPKKLNIEKAKAYTTGDYVNGYPSPFNVEFIYRIKQPQLLAPTTVYANDSTKLVNHLDKKLFQFKVEHVFDDYEVSAWSPISKTVFPLSNVVAGANNKILVTVQTGTAIVKRIRIAVKEVNNTDFSLVVDLDKAQQLIGDNTSYTFSFYNDGNYLPLEVNESIKLFDNVPKRSKAQEIIKGDRIVDGLITEGFDAVPIDMRLNWYPAANTGYGVSLSGLTITAAGTGYSAGEIIAIIGNGSGAIGQILTVSGGGAILTVALLSDGANYTTATALILSAGVGATITPVLSSSGSLPVNALKRGGDYVYGLIYYDHANRSGTTNINTGGWDTIQPDGKYGTELFIPFYTEKKSFAISYAAKTGTYQVGERVVGGTTHAQGIFFRDDAGLLYIQPIYGGFSTGEVVTGLTSGAFSTVVANTGPRTWEGTYPIVDYSIFNEPPSWATHYQIARVKNAANDRYLQFVADSMVYHDKDGTPKTFGDPTIVSVDIGIKQITGEFLVANPGSLLVYDFVKGDRIRFIKDVSGGFVTTNYFDFEIGSYNTGTFDLGIKFPGGTVPTDFPNLTKGTLFEIYHPQLTIPADNKVTFEIAEGNTVSYDAITGKYFHDSAIKDQFWWAFNSASDNGGYLQLSGTLPTGLVVDDFIRITQTSPFVNASYNTYAVVRSTPSATSVVLSIPFALADPTVTGFIASAATGIFDGGDTFYRVRTMPYDTIMPDYPDEIELIEDANYSDFFVSPGYDYGRPNRIDPEFREVTRLSTIYYSEKFIPATNINGLSSVFDTNFESYEDRYGGIYKLYSEDLRLDVFQELKVGAILVEQSTINTTSGTSVVGQSADVLNTTMMYYAGEYGIGKNPESFAVYANAKYFVDIRRGSALRLSTDGITAISDTGNMHNYFTDKCKALMNNVKNDEIFGVYDVKFGEYLIAFANLKYSSGGVPFDIPAETIAWNEKFNAWSTFYSFHPQTMIRANSGILSFNLGALYLHNSNSAYGNFYGVQYKPEVWITLNDNPSNVKIAQAIGEETLSPWEVYEITTPGGQLSNLLVADFSDIEDQQYASVLRDTNTPNVTDPIINGDPMRDRTFLFKLRYPLTDYNKLFVVDLRYIISNLHNQ